MKFLHAADIHLDSPLAGLRARDDLPDGVIRHCTRRAFSAMIDLALAEDVAFVVIAGDLYDGDWKDFSTGLFFAEEMRRLARPCFLLRGNHDARSLITRTLTTLSNVRVRNVATVGGALAHGDPHMDLPPVLMALGATITIVGPKGERSLALEDLFSGYYETVLEKNELIAEVHVLSQGPKKAAYMKVTTGSADDWPALGIAVVLEADGKAIKSARVVASAATNKATRMKSAEAALAGKTVDDKVLAQAGDAAAEEAEILADVRGSVPYKRELIRVYVRRAVRAAIDGQGAH